MISLQQACLTSPSWGTPPFTSIPTTNIEPSCDTLESYTEPSALEPTYKSSSVMKSSEQPEKPFEELMYQVLSLLIKEEEKATLILRDAIFAEKQWQKSLTDLLEKEHVVCHSYEQRNETMHKVSDIVLPLSLFAEGVAAICISGVGMLPLGAAALGAFLFLDTILDNKVKESVASVLARGDGEETKTWFQRICITTTLTIYGLSFFTPGTQPIQLVINASKVALTCTGACTEKQLNDQKARLLESEKQYENSGRYLKEILGDVDRQVKSVNSLFTLLSDLQKSTSQATARIF